jgi:hypothetical protein
LTNHAILLFLLTLAYLRTWLIWLSVAPTLC